MTHPMPVAAALAEKTGARLTLPSKPLLYRKKGEAEDYFNKTTVLRPSQK